MGAAPSHGKEPQQRWGWPGAPCPHCLGNTALERRGELWPAQGPSWVLSWRYLHPDPRSLPSSPAPQLASARGKGRQGEALGKSDVLRLQLPCLLQQPEPREGRAVREPWHSHPASLLRERLQQGHAAALGWGAGRGHRAFCPAGE